MKNAPEVEAARQEYLKENEPIRKAQLKRIYRAKRHAEEDRRQGIKPWSKQ